MRAQINFYLMLLAVLGLAPATTQARYLNPSTGRFQTMDSYEGNNQDPPSLQKYIDAGDDPVNKIDPSGHESIDEVLAVVNAGVFQSPKGAEASAGVRMKKILAPRRSLTQGEINLAKTVYGENIDYPKTGVEYGKWAFFQPDGREMTPDGFIHTGGQTISDYTTPGAKPNFPYPIILQEGTLIHELCHVWQYQHGVNVVLRGLYRNYNYAGPNFGNLAFSDYGIEQQAEMTEDYFYLSSGYQNSTMPSPIPPLATYEKILPFLPK